MSKRLFSIYKTPLLLTVTLIITLIAIKVPREPLVFTYIILGALLGTFLLDLDYIIYAFFLEPEADFSKTLTAFFRHGDLFNAFSYIQYHKDEIKEKTLNSIIFQVVLAGISLYVVYSNTGFFIRSLILSAFLNSLYRLSEHYFTQTTDEWFWALKNKPSQQKTAVVGIALFGLFVICVSLF